MEQCGARRLVMFSSHRRILMFVACYLLCCSFGIEQCKDFAINVSSYTARFHNFEPQFEYRGTCNTSNACCDNNSHCTYDGGDFLAILRSLPKQFVTLNITRSNIGNVTRHVLLDFFIQHIYLDRNSILEISPEAFGGVSNVQELFLRWNNITELRKDVFKGLTDLKILLLDGNQIRLNNSRFVEGDLAALRRLSLADNPIETLGRYSLEWLRNSSLEWLNLQKCQLKEVHPESMEPIKHHLMKLDLSKNWNIPMSALNNLTIGLEGGILQNINFNRLGLQDIPTDALSYINATLECLSLQWNLITYITGSSFPDLLSLKYLYLDDCDILYVSEDSFLQLPNLLTLTLSGNRLMEIPSAVTILSTLTYLDMSYNPESFTKKDWKPSLSLASFEGLQSLQVLDLSNTMLETLLKDSFVGLNKLKLLKLHNAHVAQIQEFAFQNLSSLCYLDISFNEISSGFLNEDVFSDLQNVEVLLANNCNLQLPYIVEDDGTTRKLGSEKSVYQNTFQKLSSVKYLDLQNNKIQQLFPAFFEFLPALEEVDLSYNFITEWHVHLFANASIPGRIKLNLRRNKFSSITSVMAEDLMKLKEVDISGNQVSCDCGWRDLKKRYKTNKTVVQNADSTCCSGADADNCLSWGNIATTNICSTSESPTLSLATVIIPSLLAVLVLASIGRLYYERSYKPRALRKNHKLDRKSSQKASYNYDVFVSYCDKDRQWVLDHLLPNLETDSTIKVCLHERDFQVGRSILDNIVRCIEESRSFLLVVSKAFVKSKWCHLEVHLAKCRAQESRVDKIILVLLEDIPTSQRPKTLQHLMKTRTYIEWAPDIHSQLLFWKRVKQAILRKEYETEFFNFTYMSSR